MNIRKQRKQRGERLPVRVRKHQAVNAIDELDLMKIYEQADRDIEELHVTEELGLVDGKDFLNCLEFKQETSVHQNVEAQGFLESQPLVFDRYLPLGDGGNASKIELPQDAFFINAFDQSRTDEPVNLNCRPDRVPTARICFIVERMHFREFYMGLFQQQGFPLPSSFPLFPSVQILPSLP